MCGIWRDKQITYCRGILFGVAFKDLGARLCCETIILIIVTGATAVYEICLNPSSIEIS